MQTGIEEIITSSVMFYLKEENNNQIRQHLIKLAGMCKGTDYSIIVYIFEKFHNLMAC